MNSVVLCDCGWMSPCSPVAIFNKHLRRHPSWFLPPQPTDRMNHHTALCEYCVFPFPFPFACHRRQCILQPIWCSRIHAKYQLASCKGFPQHSCCPWWIDTTHRRVLPTETLCWWEQNLRLLHWIRLAEQIGSAIFQYHPEATSSNLQQRPFRSYHSIIRRNWRILGGLELQLLLDRRRRRYWRRNRIDCNVTKINRECWLMHSKFRNQYKAKRNLPYFVSAISKVK